MNQVQVARAIEEIRAISTSGGDPFIAGSRNILRDPWGTPYQKVKIKSKGENGVKIFYISLGPDRSYNDEASGQIDDIYGFDSSNSWGNRAYGLEYWRPVFWIFLGTGIGVALCWIKVKIKN